MCLRWGEGWQGSLLIILSAPQLAFLLIFKAPGETVGTRVKSVLMGNVMCLYMHMYVFVGRIEPKEFIRKARVIDQWLGALLGEE